MKLMIVESPNKRKKIGDILGPGWKIEASVGHIRDLPLRDLGLDPANNYKMTYEPTERGKDVIPKLKAAIKGAEEVYLATDPDREGEAIAWHLQQALGLREYQRVTFDSITEPTIKAAIQKPRRINGALVASQEARRGADRLMGWKMSSALAKGMGITGLAAGRVQTAALRLVVDRQAEIDNFKPVQHFGALAKFDDGAWTAEWNTTPFLAEEQRYILDPAIAEAAASCTRFRVTASESKKATKAPPPPFTTATLLQAASVSLNMKPKQTADVAQELFHQGLITYHRTDSQNFSEEALALIRAHAEKAGLPLPPKPRTWKSKESAQEAHEAIRPTHLEQRTAGDTKEQQQLYSLIWHRAVASQLADAEYNVTILALTSEADGKQFVFDAKGSVLTFPGWRGLTSKDAAEDTETPENPNNPERDNGKVPSLTVGAAVTADSTTVLRKKTQAPSGYTQASLIKKLEAEGIGRPSTYAGIIERILFRKYMDDAKKILMPTPLGVAVIRELTGQFQFVEFKYTRELEEALDDIATGKNNFPAVVRGIDTQLDQELTTATFRNHAELVPADRRYGNRAGAEENTFTCPACHEGQVRRPRGTDFYSCNRHKDGCKFSVNVEVAGKKLTDKQVETLITKGRVGPLKGFKSKAGAAFDAALVISAETGWRSKFDFTGTK